MKIVDIIDIEDLIKTKMEIDDILISNKEIEEKLDLGEFMKKYCLLDKYSYMKGSLVYPFQYYDIYGNKYLFVANKKENEETINIILSFLKRNSYNINNIKSLSMKDIGNSFEDISKTELIINNGKYYSVN